MIILLVLPDSEGINVFKGFDICKKSLNSLTPGDPLFEKLLLSQFDSLSKSLFSIHIFYIIIF